MAPRNKNKLTSVLQAWDTVTDKYEADLISGIPGRLKE